MKKIMRSFIACIMTFLMYFASVFPAYADGSAPVAENLELTTYRNSSVGGTLAAYDPEDDVVSYEIITEPVKGSIKLESNGSFVYTPHEGKKGRDYFGYKAIDSAGNMSQEATVIIRIEKQKQGIRYSDMENQPGEYAALLLCEKGLFTGKNIGGMYCFKPEAPISRGDFLSMCMIVSGRESVQTVMNTGYADDETIPQWMKGYIVSACMAGICQAPASADSIFDAEEAISRSEAMQILNDALGLYNVGYYSFEQTDEPVLQACINLGAVGIIDENISMEDKLTRQEAAMILAGALEVLENR